eukprot:6915948-Alexandrium_andersonii.AAC.1
MFATPKIESHCGGPGLPPPPPKGGGRAQGPPSWDLVFGVGKIEASGVLLQTMCALWALAAAVSIF